MKGGCLIGWAAGAVLGALVGVAAPTSAPQAPVPALQDLVIRGAEAFRAGAWAEAETAFGLAETHYGASDAWRRGDLARRLAPLHGFAAYQNGHDADAVRLLRLWLRTAGEGSAAEGFVRHALAQAFFRSGDPLGACAELEALERLRAGRPEAVLAALLRARWLQAAGRGDDAAALLARLSEEGGPVTAAAALQARLDALRLALDSGATARAADLLLGQPWPAARMPEVGALALAALQVADRCLAEGRPGEAWRALLLVPTHGHLVREQEREVERLREALGAPGAAPLGPAWREFHARRLQRMEALLAALRTAEDHTPGVWFRQGQAGLLLGRSHEACLAFERVATDPEAPDDLRREARHRWSLAAAQASAWETVLALARVQLAEAPGDPRTLDALSLAAQAHLELGRIDEAERTVRLVLDTPGVDAERAGRARLLLGFCHLRADRMADAAAAFALAAEVAALHDRARLWQATAEELGGRPEAALALLQPLRDALRGRPLHPDVLHRIASASRLRGDEAAAAEAASEHVRDHPLHHRRTEVLILLGDARLGLGQADAAVAAFEMVDPGAGPAFAYAVFQQAKVLQARAQWTALEAHLAVFLERGLPWRRTEAVTLRTRALRELGRLDEARDAVAAALQAHGGDPRARDVPSLLRLWSDLGGDAPDAAAWRAAERERAYRDQRYTWWSRLTVAEAVARRRAGRAASADELGLDLVRLAPREALDAAGLLAASVGLATVGSPDAEEYLRDVVERFPSSPESVEARMALAEAGWDAGRRAEAAVLVEAVLARWPAHPAARRAVLLQARGRVAEGRAREGIELLQELLKRRDVRGRLQAEALYRLAEAWEAAGGRREAVASLQRVFTLHVAQADLAAGAWENAVRLLEDLGERGEAAELCAQLAACADLEATGAPARARAWLDARKGGAS